MNNYSKYALQYVKYSIEGIPADQDIRGGSLIDVITHNYINKNKVNAEQLNAVFPIYLNGKKFRLFLKKEEMEAAYWPFIATFILSDGEEIVINYKYGIEHLPEFITMCGQLGYKIDRIPEEASITDTIRNEEDLLTSFEPKFNFSDLTITEFKQLLSLNYYNEKALISIYNSLECAIEADISLIVLALVADKETVIAEVPFIFNNRFEYPKFFCRSLEILKSKSLITLVLENYEVKINDIYEDGKSRKYFLRLLFCYFYFNLMSTILKEKNKKLMIEYIAAQTNPLYLEKVEGRDFSFLYTKNFRDYDFEPEPEVEINPEPYDYCFTDMIDFFYSVLPPYYPFDQDGNAIDTCIIDNGEHFFISEFPRFFNEGWEDRVNDILISQFG